MNLQPFLQFGLPGLLIGASIAVIYLFIREGYTLKFLIELGKQAKTKRR